MTSKAEAERMILENIRKHEEAMKRFNPDTDPLTNEERRRWVYTSLLAMGYIDGSAE